jgi:hypothetical protein
MESIFSYFPGLIEAAGEGSDAHRALVFAAWRKAAGEALCGHTEPLELSGKRLVIAVADRSWKRNLESLAGQMVFQLNSVLGTPAVTYISFEIDPRTVGNAIAERAVVRPDEPAPDLGPELQQSAEAIRDEELRTQFLLAAGSCLSRVKRLEEKH